MRLIVSTCVGVLACAPAWAMQWDSTGDATHYAVQGRGDAASEQGAVVTVRSIGDAADGFGGGVASVDAAPFRGRRVRLSGLVTTDAVAGQAGLWLRADDASGSVAFANTQHLPVAGDAQDEMRDVEITVPAGAQRLLFGPFLAGRGRMSVSQLRLRATVNDPAATVPPATIVEAAVDIVRRHALYADRIDWPLTRKQLDETIADADAAEAAYAAVERLLSALDDRHSMLLRPSQARRYAQEGVAVSPLQVTVDGGVGRVVLPAFHGSSAEAADAFARLLARRIAEAAPQARCGWIVDLRRNGGGNMWPMLNGLAPLLGTQTVGYFRDRAGADTPWRVTPPDPPVPDLSATRVAVLIGPQTASSGEAVAVAFRGRAHTRSFGQPTAGLSTANDAYDLPDGAQLMLTIARFVDRTGQAYGGPIAPDQPSADADADAAQTLCESTAQTP